MEFIISYPMWNIEETTGYKPQTTFWMDFSIADKFGINAIQDTFNRAFSEWKKKIVYLTELSLVLNHKCWQWSGKNEKFSQLYDKLWRQVEDYAYSNLKDEELSYYYRITD